MDLPLKSLIKIDDIFNRAHEDKRNMLFEYEVYEMLSISGLAVPKYLFIKDGSTLSSELLKQFGKKIVIKVVSADIIHKQKIGGVKIIDNNDFSYIKFILKEMKNEIFSYFSNDNKPIIAGFILVEYIEFSKSLGNELLVGIKSDRAFGPVVTVSKGGDDAEFFAKHYDPANIFLPHITDKESDDLANSLKISKKFIEFGHPEYTEFIARCVSTMSFLAYYYSNINKNTKFYIESLDINPFVFAKNGNFYAVDGYVSFLKIEETKKEFAVNIKNLVPFFKPNGIAVIGVTSESSKYSMGKEIAHLLLEFNRDDIYCVNPKGGFTNIANKEYKLYKSIDEIKDSIELAIYTAPAKYIPAFFEDIKINIPKSVVLIPGIPTEMGYEKFKNELDNKIPKGTRVIGPNCVGVYYGKGKDSIGVNSMFIEEERLNIKSNEKSNVLLLTQSGGMAITMIDKLKNTPIFKAVVSFGNKFDVKITDLLALFENQNNIDVIALYVEGFDNLEGRLFFELAKESKKPIIVYKGGKTEAGAKAAASHTAAMTGDYEVFKAACRQSGVILIDDTYLYMNCIKCFSMLANKKIKGHNVAGVLNAGFEATIFSDELGNLTPAKLSDTTLKVLDKINVHGLVDTSTSILDVTPMTDDVMYGEYIEALLKDENVNSIVVGVVPHVENIKSTPNTCHREDSLSNILVKLFKKYDKPIVVSVNASQYYGEFVSIMEKGGLPVYSDIRTAVRTLEMFSNFYL